MYRLQSRFDLQRLVGKVLRQVIFAKYQVGLSFSDDISIDIEAKYTCLMPAIKTLSLPEDVHQSYALIVSLEATVVAVEIQNDTDLSVNFDNGLTLLITADPNYESYHLDADGQRVTV